jgi:hypothetical protein
LKGGTALNLLADVPPRLSVDLDFNFVGSVEREEMLAARPDVERSAVTVARALGYQVQISRNDHAGRKFFLRYIDLFGAPNRIELDLNFLHRQPLEPLVELPLWQPAEAARPIARAMSVSEIANGKMCALIDRAAPRDFFDAPLLPQRLGDTWRSPRFRRLFVAMAGTLPRSLHSYDRSCLEKLTDRSVELQLRLVLPSGDLPTLERLREDAWNVVAPLLHLDDREREYTERLQVGEILPALLFPDDADLCDKLARHPALLWKAKNAAEHARKGSETAGGEAD